MCQIEKLLTEINNGELTLLRHQKDFTQLAAQAVLVSVALLSQFVQPNHRVIQDDRAIWRSLETGQVHLLAFFLQVELISVCYHVQPEIISCVAAAEPSDATKCSLCDAI